MASDLINTHFSVLILKMVKTGKVRKKVWGKRQSCTSNPSSRSYRNAARRGFGSTSSSQTSSTEHGRMNLTVQALAKHNAEQTDNEVMCFDEETARTVKSFATVSISGLTDCSNPTFSGVLKRFWQSPGANHKDVRYVCLFEC